MKNRDAAGTVAHETPRWEAWFQKRLVGQVGVRNDAGAKRRE